MKLYEILIFTGVLFVGVLSFSIRELELDDDELDQLDHAAVARAVVHKSDWTALGTISTLKNVTGFPFVNLKSVADSARGEPSTGNIYFYMIAEDFSARDLMKDNKLTVLFSDDQDLACSKKGIDPMEPTCTRVIIVGSAVEIYDTDSDEYKFGSRAIISRHPAAVNWLKVHRMILCKIKISYITLLDQYGGPIELDVKDYYNVKHDNLNGFLKKAHLKSNGEGLVLNKNEHTIQIKIKKGEDSVFFEL